MTAEQLAKRIEEMPIGPLAFWVGLTEDQWQEVAAARRMLAAALSDLGEALSVRQQLRGAALNEYRVAIIEECARVLEATSFHDLVSYDLNSGKPIINAAAIRALKDKP